MSDPNREGLDEVIGELRRTVHTSASFDERVMERVRSSPRVRRLTFWARLMVPRTIRFVPLPTAILAASLVLSAVLAGGMGMRHVIRRAAVRDSMRLAAAAAAAADSAAAAHAPPAARAVQFVLVAPGAHKVAVAGDFNDWNPSHADFVASHQGGGVWALTAQIPAGHHRYSFVVDDTMWVPDPAAPRIRDDDFGQPASALVVDDGGL